MTPDHEPPAEPVRVIVADDAPAIRDGVARLLTSVGIEVVARAGDAEELLSCEEALRPHMVITDVRMPPGHTTEGLEAANRIRALRPGVGMILLSQHLETRHALQLVGRDATGVGYLLKDRIADITGFASLVRRVAGGGSAIDPVVVERLRNRRRGERPFDALSEADTRLLAAIGEGMTDAEIAMERSVPDGVIAERVSDLFGVLGIESDGNSADRVASLLRRLAGGEG